MSFFLDSPQLKIIQQMARRRRVAVHLVGGFLRDVVLGRPGIRMDFDFAVEKGALAFARSFARQIKGAYVLLDGEHGCARVVKRTEKGIATFDFADYRAKTFKADLAHRDFTINTLSVDLKSLDEKADLRGLIRDAKHGLKDLQQKTLRCVTLKAFQDDPLRLLRAFSLQAALGFTIEARTLRQIKKDKQRLRQAAYERIREELFKILESPRAASTFKAMDKIDFLEQVIPQIKVMEHCLQGGYHHLDVWPHSLEVVGQLETILEEKKNDADIGPYLAQKIGGDHSRQSLMKLAALLHDIGKPQTRKEEPGRVSFHGHEHVGRDISRAIAKMLKISTAERHALEDMVLWHLRPGYLSNFQHPSEKSIYRYFRDTKEEAASILLLSLADQRSTRGPLTTERDQQHHETICLRLVEQFFNKKKEKPFVRLINGKDLIRNLKLKPSPFFGKILTAVEEAQNLGKITVKEEALALAKKLVDKGTND
jgi:putative nucleotidyltransferase with HDIG domain